MLRMATLALFTAATITVSAQAQVRIEDPTDYEEILEQQFLSPYYGDTTNGYGRAQRPRFYSPIPLVLLRGGHAYARANYSRGVGLVLTDLEQHTLYATERDTDYEVSSLSGEALKAFQPYTVSRNAGLARPWGKAYNPALDVWVLTFLDKPLYRHVDDKAPGDANGHGGDFYKIEILG